METTHCFIEGQQSNILSNVQNYCQYSVARLAAVVNLNMTSLTVFFNNKLFGQLGTSSQFNRAG